MDLPVHVAAGAVTASTLLYIESKRERGCKRKDIVYMVKLGGACFLWGVLGHLFLDWLPHYDWLFFKLPFFGSFPMYWMHPQFLTTIPVLLLSFLLMKDYWPIVTVAILGSIYPDIEKMMYFGLKSLDFSWGESFILFPWHSLYLSGRPWEYEHKHFLITTQNALFFAMMWGILWLNEHRKNRQYCAIPPLSWETLKQAGKWRVWGTHFIKG